MSPQERLELLIELRDRRDPDAAEVEYLVVGAFAVAFHGFPRYTAESSRNLALQNSGLRQRISGAHRAGPKTWEMRKNGENGTRNTLTDPSPCHCPKKLRRDTGAIRRCPAVTNDRLAFA